MGAKPPTDHVSQPMDSTWRQQPAVTQAPAPPPSSVPSSSPSVNHGQPKPSTDPSPAVTTVTSVAPPVSGPIRQQEQSKVIPRSYSVTAPLVPVENKVPKPAASQPVAQPIAQPVAQPVAQVSMAASVALPASQPVVSQLQGNQARRHVYNRAPVSGPDPQQVAHSYEVSAGQPASQYVHTHHYRYQDNQSLNGAMNGLPSHFDGKNSGSGAPVLQTIVSEPHYAPSGHLAPATMPISHSVPSTQLPSASNDKHSPPHQYQNGKAPLSHGGIRGSPYKRPHDNKALDGMEALKGDPHGHSQTPTYIQHHQHDFTVETQRNAQKQMQAQVQHHAYHMYQPSPPHLSHPPQSHIVYPPPRLHPQVTYVQSDQHVLYPGEEPADMNQDIYDGSNRYRYYGARGYQEEIPHGTAVPTLPPARSLPISNGFRSSGAGFHNDVPRRMEVSHDSNTSGQITGSTSLRQVRDTGSLHPKGWTGNGMADAFKAFQSNGGANIPDRNEFISVYQVLVNGYEEKCDALYDSVDASCISLIVDARIPYLVDTMTAPVDDETPEDAKQKLVVKREFVDAMEKLQGDQLPTKRRGNLPKESTAYLKRWFDEHYDHPYPTDEEKLAMSKITKIGMQQISHWFINYRKRVWKPSLPASHPVHSGDNSKRPRKKQRKDDS